MAPNETDDDSEEGSGPWWRRPIEAVVAAARWVADTFHGYAGVRELKRNRR
ncbi:hypothetical protein ACFPM1_05850 [Halorubrum rubrum]|uniref:Uncharacterized protein n=1 Tax=Halorubrum rubrum TaxID=1126240 RepID=A0ABD5R010_9EURY|nr:hypothetical protein [Halorubrum rubrum]